MLLYALGASLELSKRERVHVPQRRFTKPLCSSTDDTPLRGGMLINSWQRRKRRKKGPEQEKGACLLPAGAQRLRMRPP
jgi:hypothetical protein